MAKIDTTNLVLHGVGSAYMIGADGKVNVKLGSLQSMTIETSASLTDVFGGDGLFPIFNFIKEKSAQFKFKNACFDLNLIAAANGEALESSGLALGHEEFTVPETGTYTLAQTSGVDVDSVVCTKDGVALTKVTTSPTAVGTYSVTAAGVMNFSTDLKSANLAVDYTYTVTDGTTLHVKTTSVPGFVELRHESHPVEMPNGKKAVMTTIVHKARCEGAVSLNYARGEAVAPELTFKSVDPLRADKHFVSYSVRYID